MTSGEHDGEHDGDHSNDGLDPADRPEPTMTKAADKAGVPVDRRAANAGGGMSETSRSRDRDLDDEDGLAVDGHAT